MAFLDNFLLPLIKTFFVFGISVFILYVIIRFVVKFTNQKFKWWVYYKVWKKPVKNTDIAWLTEAINKKMTRDKVKRLLLIRDIKGDQLYELLYLYDQLNLKGGDKNGREFERGYKKIEGTKSTSTAEED